jgi:predicted RNA-binding Zn ribbon-like protein
VWRRAFLRQWHFRVDDPDDDSARSRLSLQRTVLRRVLESYMSSRPLGPSLRRALEAQMNRAPAVLSISGGPGAYGLALKRSGAAWDVVTAEIATSAARLISQQRAVKECANPDCSWLFVDESKPRSRRWCDVSICGSLVNVRRHRARYS